MFLIVCRDHGNFKVEKKCEAWYARDEKQATCPACLNAAVCYAMPAVCLEFPCLQCGLPTTLRSLWDERHRHFFCNPLCVGDYDQAILDEIKGNAHHRRTPRSAKKGTVQP